LLSALKTGRSLKRVEVWHTSFPSREEIPLLYCIGR